MLSCCGIGIGAWIDSSCIFHHLGPRCVVHFEAMGDAPGRHVPRLGYDDLLGCLKIGDGAVIDANAVMTRLVPAGCTVAGAREKCQVPRGAFEG